MLIWIGIVLAILQQITSLADKGQKVVKADCIFHGVRHGELWTDPLIPCKQKKCIDGHMIDHVTGCIHNGKCYRVDEKWKEGCSTRTCVYFEDYHMGNKVKFYAVDGRAWCVTQDNQCKAPDEIWEYQCNQYRCVEEDLVYVKEARVEKIGSIPGCGCCKHKGICHNDGTSWSGDNCTEHYCDLVNNGGEIMPTITSVPGCEFNGRCYKFSETVVDGCFTFECTTQDGIHIKWDPIQRGCAVGLGCIHINASYKNESSCMEYYCNEDATMVRKQYGCVYKDRCIPYGEYYYDDLCYYRLCFLEDNMAVSQPKRGGCSGVNDRCYSYGEKGFSRVINGKVVVNCTCEQRGKTGSLTTCVGMGSGNIPNIVSYQLDDSKTGSDIYIRQDHEVKYHDNNIESGLNYDITKYTSTRTYMDTTLHENQHYTHGHRSTNNEEHKLSSSHEEQNLLPRVTDFNHMPIMGIDVVPVDHHNENHVSKTTGNIPHVRVDY